MCIEATTNKELNCLNEQVFLCVKNTWVALSSSTRGQSGINHPARGQNPRIRGLPKWCQRFDRLDHPPWWSSVHHQHPHLPSERHSTQRPGDAEEGKPKMGPTDKMFGYINGVLKMGDPPSHTDPVVSILNWSNFWMIWGTTHFRKPPYNKILVDVADRQRACPYYRHLMAAPCWAGINTFGIPIEVQRESASALQTSELLLDPGAITAIMQVAPCNNWAIYQDCSKRTICALNLLHISELVLDCGAIPTKMRTTPGHNGSISQDRSECPLCASNLLHPLKLILDSRAVTTRFWIAPCNHWSISQDRSKRTGSRLNLLNTMKLILDSRCVATIPWTAPCNNGSICQDGSKCTARAMNLVHISELILNCGAVTTTVWIAPGNNGSIFQDRGKGPSRCSDLLYIPELILDFGAVCTTKSIAPGYNRSIPTNCCECATCCLHLLNVPKLILDPRTVATKVSVAPSNNRSICKHRCKCLKRGLKLLDISQNQAFATTFWVAPSHNLSIFQESSEGPSCAINFLHISELILDRRAVTTI